MNTANNKIYLADIAKEKNIKDPKDVLSVLMPYDVIFAHVDNFELLLVKDDSGNVKPLPFPTLPIKITEHYLQIIYTNGFWAGRKIHSSIVIEPYNPYWEEENNCSLYVEFENTKRFTIKDLFVFKGKLADLEGKNPDIFTPKPATSSKLRLTGSRKDTVRIEKTRQACEEIKKELYREKHILDTDCDNWNPKLLFSAGKTKKELFLNAVKGCLGEKYHRDTAVEVWNTIPADLKLKGRGQDE